MAETYTHIMLSKALVRKEALEIRRALAADEAAAWNRAIHGNLLTIPELAEADTVLCYVDSKDTEVATHPFIEHVLAQGKTVLVPIARKRGQLVWSRLLALSELSPSLFGIPEPTGEYRRIVAPPMDAVVLVPGIAFTRQGYRIGYGAGYYDRFLAGHTGIKIGLAFECQIVPAFDVEAHDVRVDLLVTETGVHHMAGALSLKKGRHEPPPAHV